MNDATREEPLFLFDPSRQGQSFTQEVRLLASLQLDLGDGSRMSAEERPPLDLASCTAAERVELRGELVHDLVDHPIRVQPHPEWPADEATRWPGCLRATLAPTGQPGAGNPWTFVIRPILSGRLRRLHNPETGSLALLSEIDLERHIRITGEAGLSLAIQALNPRQKLVALATLELQGVPAVSPTVQPVLASMLAHFGQPLVHRLQVLLNQCSSGTRDPGRMLQRFFIRLFAAGFGTRHRHEARAVALRLDRREGSRLLRAYEGSHPRHESVALTVRALSMALLEASAITGRTDLDASGPFPGGKSDEPG